VHTELLNSALWLTSSAYSGTRAQSRSRIIVSQSRLLRRPLGLRREVYVRCFTRPDINYFLNFLREKGRRDRRGDLHVLSLDLYNGIPPLSSFPLFPRKALWLLIRDTERLTRARGLKIAPSFLASYSNRSFRSAIVWTRLQPTQRRGIATMMKLTRLYFVCTCAEFRKFSRSPLAAAVKYYPKIR